MSRILIVEDETALRELYVTLFTFEKFEVSMASHGRDAMKLLDTIEPDVILLDIMMPVMNGFEFLQEAKLAKSHPKTRVLVLSNLSDPKTLATLTELGAHHYILKSSISPGKLVDAVRKLMTT